LLRGGTRVAGAERGIGRGGIKGAKRAFSFGGEDEDD